MGFLSAWDGATRIDVSDLAGDPPGTWWVDLKRCLTHEEAEAVMRALAGKAIDVDNTAGENAKIRSKLSMDTVIDHQEDLVLMSILSWNLTDRDGTLLPFHPTEELKESLSHIPSPVYDRIAEAVMAANSETREEAKTFPAAGSGSSENADDDTSDDREVLV